MKNKLTECLENGSQKKDLLECRWLVFHFEIALKYIDPSYSNSHIQKHLLNNHLQMLKLHSDFVPFYKGVRKSVTFLIIYSSDSQMWYHLTHLGSLLKYKYHICTFRESIRRAISQCCPDLRSKWRDKRLGSRGWAVDIGKKVELDNGRTGSPVNQDTS